MFNRLDTFKVYIFDLDGTIIDSSSLMIEALDHCLQETKLNVNYNEFFAQMGDSLENIFYSLGIPLDLIPVYRKYSQDNLLKITVFEDVVTFINHLHDINKKIVLFTGKDYERTMILLKHFRLEHLFHFIITPEHLTAPKPDPEGIYVSLSHFNVSKDEAIMIGDSAFDIIAANRAGVSSLFVKWGTGILENVQLLNPTYTCNLPKDLHYFSVGNEKHVKQ